MKEQRKKLLKLDKNITAFNIGVNAGVDAGQSIMHCHIHLIPRRKGDTPYPKGGVRHVIPLKGDYDNNELGDDHWSKRILNDGFDGTQIQL